MTKAELINYVAKDCNTSKALTEKMLNNVFSHVGKCLKKKDKITLTGFGTFYTSKRKPRRGRNPQTGAPINIKGGYVAKFKPGKWLKKSVQA